MPPSDTTNNQAAAGTSVTLGLAAVFITYFASTYFFRGIGVALPRVAADLNGMALYSWAISMPALASAFAALLFGKLSDMYGRRLLLLLSLVLYMAGGILCVIGNHFVLFIIAHVILSLGQGSLSSLCFSTIGDMYEPVQRSRWSGRLQVPAGIAAIIGPTMVGMITDTLNWRYFFCLTTLLAAISIVLVMSGITAPARKSAGKVDWQGSVLLAIALSLMIVAFSLPGNGYPWASVQVVGLFTASIVVWVVLFRVEKNKEDPILDPRIVANRTFLTAAVAGLLSYPSMLAIIRYYPLFLQGVQGTTATASGQIITPFGILMAFIGVPTGALVAGSRRYKWLLITGYTIVTAASLAMVTFDAGTPIWLGILVTTVSGFGLGAIPTINTLVSQFAVSKKLLGVAVGAIFAFVFMGGAIAPAILGSAMNQTYTGTLEKTLPVELDRLVDKSILASLADPKVLISKEAMSSLEKKLTSMGDQGPELFQNTVRAIRQSLEAGLKTVFWIAAISTIASWLLILTIPEVSIESEK
jgi:MFS family permease